MSRLPACCATRGTQRAWGAGAGLRSTTSCERRVRCAGQMYRSNTGQSKHSFDARSYVFGLPRTCPRISRNLVL